MATTNTNKKPLVMLDAANPEQEINYAPGNQGMALAGSQPQAPIVQDNTPIINEDQLNKEQGKEQPPQTPTNKVKVPLRDTKPTTPGGVNLNMPRIPVAEKYDVLEGAPAMSIYDHLLREKEKDDEKDQARRRRDALFNAISDGVTSISDIYFASKGAPYAGPSKSLVEANEEGHAKRKKERDDRFNQRMQMLKDRESMRYRLLNQKLKEERAAADLKYRQDRIDAENRRTEVLRQRNEEEAKRKRLKDEADQRNKEVEQKRKQQETNSKVKNYEDQMAKRRNNNVPASATSKKGNTKTKKKTPGRTPGTNKTYNHTKGLGL